MLFSLGQKLDAVCAFQSLPGKAESPQPLGTAISTCPAAHTGLSTADREGEQARKDRNSKVFRDLVSERISHS